MQPDAGNEEIMKFSWKYHVKRYYYAKFNNYIIFQIDEILIF